MGSEKEAICIRELNSACKCHWCNQKREQEKEKQKGEIEDGKRIDVRRKI